MIKIIFKNYNNFFFFNKDSIKKQSKFYSHNHKFKWLNGYWLPNWGTLTLQKAEQLNNNDYIKIEKNYEQ